MTAQQPVFPRITPRTQRVSNQDYYLTPSPASKMRNLVPRAGPRIQTMPPTSEDPVGIYSYLDQEDIDEQSIVRTIEALESGEFCKVPEEIINWYNSINQDLDEVWEDDDDAVKQLALAKATHYEYIDPETDRSSAFRPEDYIAVRESFKQVKPKTDKMHFIKLRLNQFLSNNFKKGVKKNPISKRPQTSSVSEPIEKYCAGVLVTSNSFDNSVSSFEYFESPKKRAITEVSIAQNPNPSTFAKDDSFYTYLDDSVSEKHKITRSQSKSLENVFIPIQPPAPTPLDRVVLRQEDPYLLPIRATCPVPPPRISSRIIEPLDNGRRFDPNLTQDYVEPRLLSVPTIPKTSLPLPLNAPHIVNPRNRSTGSRPTEYLLPEDTPLTPMTRFTKEESALSIPVLSPDADYNDPLDFKLTELCQERTNYKSRQMDMARPRILPKPFVSKRSCEDVFTKPIPPPKPRRAVPPKPNKPKHLRPDSNGISRRSPTLISRDSIS